MLLQNGTLGETVDETEGLIKRHRAFEKLLSSQEEKVRSPVCVCVCVSMTLDNIKMRYSRLTMVIQ